MAENVYFMDGVDFTEATYNAYMKKIMANDGYLVGEGSALAVIQNTPAAMNVVVGTGKAWVRGVLYENTAAKTVTVDAADATHPRIDRIVVRLTWVDDTVEAVYLKGTAAASPAAPALTQSSAVWELSLAQILVPVSKTSIVTGDITDERDTAYCGQAACRLGTAHIDADGALDMADLGIHNVADPVDAQDAATRAFVLTNPGLPALESGKFLSNNGAALSWETVASFHSIAASDDLLTSSDAEATTASSTYVLLKRIQIPPHIVKGGVVRVKFGICNNNNSATVYGRLYVNGVAIGTEQSTTSSSVQTKSEDITLTGIGGGAFLELWGAANSDTCKLSNFRIYGAETANAPPAW